MELYINGIKADITQDTEIKFNKQKLDYTNPTIVRNSYTYSVYLPFTDTNNKIFNNIWKLDRYQTRLTFNPSKRIQFVLTNNGSLVETGYIRLDTIDTTTKRYNVTLFAELGNLLYTLSYKIDSDGNNVEMTLGDLTYDFNLGFTINKNVIRDAWASLSNNTNDKYKTINFCVAHNGTSQAKNFKADKCWVSVNRTAPVNWNSTEYAANAFPSAITKDNVYYSAINAKLNDSDPDDKYGLLELSKAATDVQIRDLRSYLQRPVINIYKMFKAMSDYLNTKLGYTIDFSDVFFNTDDFKNTWMTLSRLEEIYSEVETGTKFSQSDLLKNTSTPAKYLVSFCKSYGLYLDVNINSNKLILRRTPRFYINETKRLIIDKGDSVTITPLSFDSPTYTFDWNNGEGESISKYQETYKKTYGSKIVNTGYDFDYNSVPYISDNVFKSGVDIIQKSGYYHHNYLPIEFDGPYYFPKAVSAIEAWSNYKLFRKNLSTNEYEETGGEMAIGRGVKNQFYWGYEFKEQGWNGLPTDTYNFADVWQDGIPRLECCGADNSNADCKDMLVRFNGFRSCYYGYLNYFETSFRYLLHESGIMNYIVSDDNSKLKEVTGYNCYIDTEQTGLDNYYHIVTSVPTFTRYDYTQSLVERPNDYIRNIYAGFNNSNVPTLYNCSFLSIDSAHFVTTANSSNARAYYTIGNLKLDHKYLILASISYNGIESSFTQDFPMFEDALEYDVLHYSYPQNVLNKYKTVGSIVRPIYTQSELVLGVFNNPYSMSCRWVVVYDLTEMNLDNTIYTVEQGIVYFHNTNDQSGVPLYMDNGFDFGSPREIYCTNAILSVADNLYSKYWNSFISDLYDINTRVLECSAYIDLDGKEFRRFYSYDNTIWVLSEYNDYDIDTKKCKCKFVKVNDRSNYLT